MHDETPDFCAVNSTLSQDDASAFEIAYKNLISNGTALLDTIVEYQPIFAGSSLYDLVKTAAQNTTSYFPKLDACILAFTPSSSLSTIQQLADTFESYATAVYNLYWNNETITTASTTN